MFRSKIKLKSHKPVLVDEVLDGFELTNAHLQIQKEAINRKVIIDATLGGGGHAAEFIKRDYFVLGIEFDESMIEIARKNLEKACPTDNQEKYFKICKGNFQDIDKIAQNNDIENVAGVLFDLGINSLQLDSNVRGFSFKDKNAPLDMRISVSKQAVTGAMLLNSLTKTELVRLFTTVMDFRTGLELAEKVENARKKAPFVKVGDFIDVIDLLKIKKGHISKATLPFMALRIAVNSELENLKTALPKAFDILEHAGILAVISFHSGEDEIVKKYFKEVVDKNLALLKYAKPIVATKQEVTDNPRARSAKLRILTKK